ncbi:MAG: dihydrolipoyl dehydrogenase family protein [Omnitrophica WOR_2 bacterium]
MNNGMDYDVVVIGGGPAGVTAALRSRELGASVALVERGVLGGVCTNDGCAPTRVLARAARLVRDTEQFEDYGLVGEPPVVDFARLMANTRRMIEKLHDKKQLLHHLQEAGVRVWTQAGEAHFMDEHTIVLENGEKLRAKLVILCNGGHARRISFPGSEYALTHSDVWSMDHLPESIVILGGAATGCQLASVFTAYGSKVTILEAGPQLLGREDSLIAETITASFKQRGIEIVTGISGADHIEKTSNGLEMVYRKGDGLHAVTAEAAIIAVGWPGNIENLDLARANVQTERGYIIVNDYLQTSVPHIFAAGDITGRMMLVQSAGYEARVAAENAILGLGQPGTHLIVPHGGFTDPEYGSVGITEEQAKKSGVDYLAATVSFGELDRAVIDNHQEGFCKILISEETHRILGAHVIGEQALEIVHLVAASMAADMWIEQLAELEIAYPTYTAIVGLAARQLVRELGVIPLSPEWGALGKPLAEWERKD